MGELMRAAFLGIQTRARAVGRRATQFRTELKKIVELHKQKEELRGALERRDTRSVVHAMERSPTLVMLVGEILNERGYIHVRIGAAEALREVADRVDITSAVENLRRTIVSRGNIAVFVYATAALEIHSAKAHPEPKS
ncbi:hypothetical protein HY988_00400 [Candidatus Micrarchaeota archaeon]|nr:hypothetical protein [Candidatus Micrarchaeota archaeon]